MEKMRIAAVQMNALKGDLAHNIAVHQRFITEAAEAGCRMVVFPELSISAHYGEAGMLEHAAPAGKGAFFEVLLDAVRRADIIAGVGFCELAYGTHYNAYALLGPDGLIGVQRKTHASSDEYTFFRMGRSLEVFDLGFCRVGTLVCYDSAFFEAWRVLALKGVDLILLPHAGRIGWGKHIPEAEQLKGLEERLRLTATHRGIFAEDNGVFAVYANQAGYNGHSTHAGGALVLRPTGETLAVSDVSLADQMVVADLDPRDIALVRSHSHFALKTRRPEIYGELTDMV